MSPSGTTPASLASGGSDQNIDFGFYKPVTIGDFVWRDLNGNGVQDAGELGISGVTLTLTGTTGSGLSVSATTNTDASGHYLFTEPPGAYTVSVSTPAGYTPTSTGKGTPATDSNPSPSPTTPSTLASGGSDLTLDFGFTAPPTITCPPSATVSCASASASAFTATQGGWGAAPHGNNVGALLVNNFAKVYGTAGVEIGIPGSSGFSLRFTSASAIEAFLPAGGTPNALKADAINPTTSNAGVFGGQVLALQLSVDFANKGITSGQPIGTFVLNDSTSPLNGNTVSQILQKANIALGGGALPSGMTISSLNDLITSLNAAFDCGTQSSWAAGHLSTGSMAVTSIDPSQTGWPTVVANCGVIIFNNYSDFLTLVSGNQVIQRTWTAFDSCGNSAGCVQTITVLLPGSTPSITSVPASGYLGCNPAVLPTDASVKALVVALNAASTNVSHVDSGVPCAMIRTFTITVANLCGNSATTNIAYTWRADTTAPVLACPPTFTLITNTTASPWYCTFKETDWSGSCGGNNWWSWWSGNNSSYGWWNNCNWNTVGTTWQTYVWNWAGGGQNWSAPCNGRNPVNILGTYFGSVYPSGCVQVGVSDGTGYCLKFTSTDAIKSCLNSSGTVGSLNCSASNPSSTSAGKFCAQVLALRLNVDCGYAGSKIGFSSPCGDLVYNDSTSPCNGKSVCQILDLANKALAGCDISASGCKLSDLSSLCDNLNQSFQGCQLSTWGACHLKSPSICPPPSVSGSPTVTDNCDSKPTVTYTDSVAAGTCAGSYVVTRTWKAVDSCGNVSTCAQTINILGPGSSTSISGLVALDVAADGSVKCDPGLSGVTVYLTNSQTKAVLSTTTDSAGNYGFYNLTAGTYIVAVKPPAGYIQTVDPDCQGLDNKKTVTVASCQSVTGINFGYTGNLPGLLLSVTANAAAATCGQVLTYTITVTNTGNTYFYGGLQIFDSLFGSGEIFHVTPVSPGQFLVFTTNYTVLSANAPSLVSTVTAIGHPPIGNAVTNKQTITIPVTCVPLVIGCPAGSAQVGAAYSSSLPASGGTPPYKSFSIKSGTFPPGLTLGSSGAITGTPTSGGCYPFTAQVTDTYGVAATVSCSISVSSVPSPWCPRDLGSCSAAGNSCYSIGCYTLNGSGADIWGSSDECQFLYQSASGDCSVVARVKNVQNIDPWSKTGLMIRETLNDNSSHCSVFVTPGNGVACQWRNGTGNSSSNVNQTGLVAAYWVKLVRRGNIFTSYCSPDGVNWTQVASQTISMGTNVYIGLAVTSHNDGTLCTATFDNVNAVP